MGQFYFGTLGQFSIGVDNGIAAYCRPENKVSLGMVEGLNNKIRVIQRSAYGYRDEDYLRLTVIASFLPPLPENARLHPH